MTKYVFKTSPDPYQREAVIKALKLKRFGVFFQQRVGKTKTAIDFTGALHVGKGFTRVLVVCPVGAIGIWEEQLEEHLAYPYEFKPFPKTAVARTKLVKEKPMKLTVVAISYGSLHSARALLKVWKPQAIVLDEIHAVKTPSSKRSKAAYLLTKDVDYVLGLTGTPIPKRPLDAFGIWKVLDSALFGTKIASFRNKYCVMGGYMGKEVVGYRNLEELSEKIASKSIRVLRKDVFDFEPSMENVVVPVALEPSARRLYDTMRRTQMVELETMERVTADIAAVRIMRLQQMCGGFVPVDTKVPDEHKMVQVSLAKRDVAVDLIEDLIEQEEKAVVFFAFLAELEEMRRVLTEKGIPALIIQGSVSREDRDKARRMFQDDPEYKYPVILVQEKTGSMAISLDSACTNIYFSMTYSLLDFQQSRDRIMGRGQTKNVTNYLLCAKNTVDEKVVKTLKKDEDLASSISDTWRWLLSD